jgi:hypothetical protein
MSQHVTKSNQLMVIFLLLILEVNEALTRFTTLISFGCSSITIGL